MNKTTWLIILILIFIAMGIGIHVYETSTADERIDTVDVTDVPRITYGAAIKSDIKSYTREQFDSACYSEHIPSVYNMWLKSSYKDFETNEVITTYMLYKARTNTTYVLRLDLVGRNDTMFLWEKRVKIPTQK